jgi:aspartate/methionine/tyrosine aminotransferase
MYLYYVQIQDTVPTHASVLSQKLALQCLTTYDHSTGSNPWFTSHLTSLDNVRNILWPILEPLGTVRTEGAFYFLVPLPDKVKLRMETIDGRPLLLVVSC